MTLSFILEYITISSIFVVWTCVLTFKEAYTVPGVVSYMVAKFAFEVYQYEAAYTAAETGHPIICVAASTFVLLGCVYTVALCILLGAHYAG